MILLKFYILITYSTIVNESFPLNKLNNKNNSLEDWFVLLFDVVFYILPNNPFSYNLSCMTYYTYHAYVLHYIIEGFNKYSCILNSEFWITDGTRGQHD